MMIGTALAAAPGPPQTPLKLPSLPKLSTTDWFPSPASIILPDSTDYERLARREANHHHYHQHGNQTTWYYYVVYGFYQFDDVESFDKAWQNTADEDHIDLARSKIIWTEYHLHRMHNMSPHELLAQWALKYAQTYLQKYNKDFLLATEIEYDEYNKSTKATNNTEKEPAWTEINRHSRRGKNSSPPPLPTPPPSPRAQTAQPTAETYYSPLQETDDDNDVIMLDTVNTNTTTTNPTSPIKVSTQETPKSTNTNKTNAQNRRPIQLRNPYKRKNKPVNPKFARQLKHLMESRTPLDRDRDENHSLSTAESSIHQDNAGNKTTACLFSTYNPSCHPTKQHATPDINTKHILKTTNPEKSPEPRTTHATTNSVSNTTYQPPDPFILINDGTQRMTVRWKPILFDQLASDPTAWENTLANTIRQMFGEHAAKTSLVKWSEQQSPSNTILLDKVPPDKLKHYLSPKISTLQSTKTFIFGIRLCAPDNHHNQWISQPATRELLNELKLEVTVSNSKSSSGNVVTAGYILMKHPVYTHRYFYLLSLRKALPNNTPFFDLATHKRTPHGENILHLVVKCGENHITGLSEILSAHLDGYQRNTALFVASQAVKSMTQEEIANMFQTHTQFIDSIQRLALYPKIVNIDRNRTERYEDATDIFRSTRDWASSLRTPAGSPLRCDAENGGPDRRAYLLVPTPHLDEVKHEFQKYLHALNNHAPTTAQNPTHTTGKDPPRPTEIYVPTPAVLNNLRFLNTLSSEQIWKCAPPTIRTTQTTRTSQTTRITQSPSVARGQMDNQNSGTVDQTLKNQTTSPAISRPPVPAQKPSNPLPFTPQYQQTNKHDQITLSDDFPPLTGTQIRQDDTTVGTTESNFTRITHANNQIHYNTKFSEIDAQIKQHQQEFQAIHTRFDSINDQLLRNMTISSDHSKQFIHLENQVSEMNAALKILLQRTATQSETQTHTRSLTHTTQQPIPRNLTPEQQEIGAHMEQVDKSNQHGSGSMSVTSTSSQSRISLESVQISSPEKKRIRKTQDSSLPNTTYSDEQDDSAQYTNGTPADTDL
jgi:hypothetical protein